MSRKPNALHWILESLEEERSYLEKPMFGALAAYLHGRLMLVLADGDEPWSGVLVATSREAHQSLMQDLPALFPHPVLGKWLYLQQSHEDFESMVMELVEMVRSGDERLGVEPKERSGKRTKGRAVKKRSKQG